jgi:hypothetical protein
LSLQREAQQSPLISPEQMQQTWSQLMRSRKLPQSSAQCLIDMPPAYAIEPPPPQPALTSQSLMTIGLHPANGGTRYQHPVWVYCSLPELLYVANAAAWLHCLTLVHDAQNGQLYTVVLLLRIPSSKRLCPCLAQVAQSAGLHNSPPTFVTRSCDRLPFKLGVWSPLSFCYYVVLHSLFFDCCV